MVGRAILAPPHIHCRPGIGMAFMVSTACSAPPPPPQPCPPPKDEPEQAVPEKSHLGNPHGPASSTLVYYVVSWFLSDPHPFFWSVSSSRGWGHMSPAMSPIFHLVACFRIFFPRISICFQNFCGLRFSVHFRFIIFGAVSAAFFSRCVFPQSFLQFLVKGFVLT